MVILLTTQPLQVGGICLSSCFVVDVNTPPVAVTAGQLTKIIPLEGLVLDGRNSTDDKKIDSYSWAQIG